MKRRWDKIASKSPELKIIWGNFKRRFKKNPGEQEALQDLLDYENDLDESENEERGVDAARLGSLPAARKRLTDMLKKRQRRA